MLEQLADYDDELMEQLLEDVPPPRDKVFDDLATDLREGMICPVLEDRRTTVTASSASSRHSAMRPRSRTRRPNGSAWRMPRLARS